MINNQRDEHGRFLAKHSILGQNNRLMIPTVDEYARMLMKLLDLPMPTPSFSRIFLTHDIDSIEQYRHWRGALGGILRGKVREVIAALKDITTTLPLPSHGSFRKTRKRKELNVFTS